jgi:hypothetical protein
MLDLHLLGDRERPPHRAGVNEDAIVNEEGGGTLSLPFAAIRPEDLDFQCFLQSRRLTIGRILFHQRTPVKETEAR